MATSEGAGHRFGHHVDVEVEGVDLDVGQPALGGEGLGDLHLVHQPELDHGLLGRIAVDLLGATHALRLLLAHHPLLDEDREDIGRL